MMKHLSETEIAEALATLPGWRRDGIAISKKFECPSFPALIAGVVRLAFDAEAANHHPDLSISYRKVVVTYWTHDEGALTRLDIDGARGAERIFSHVDSVS
jgi:4a-hydroxytetrahydrobiopterin dehydratase